jgi:hypothetical protein
MKKHKVKKVCILNVLQHNLSLGGEILCSRKTSLMSGI